MSLRPPSLLYLLEPLIGASNQLQEIISYQPHFIHSNLVTVTKSSVLDGNAKLWIQADFIVILVT